MTLDVRSLLSACTNATESWISFCHGYVQAAHDASYASGRHVPICVPPGTSRSHLADLFARQAFAAITVEPSIGDVLGVAFAHAIFADAYPCGG